MAYGGEAHDSHRDGNHGHRPGKYLDDQDCRWGQDTARSRGDPGIRGRGVSGPATGVPVARSLAVRFAAEARSSLRPRARPWWLKQAWIRALSQRLRRPGRPSHLTRCRDRSYRPHTDVIDYVIV